MYAIATVIWGIPLNSNKSSVAKSEDLEAYIEEMVDDQEKDEPFISLYSGGSDVPPLAFGIQIDEFDECCHHVDLDSIKWSKIPPEKSIRFTEEWAKVPEEFRKEILAKFGGPRMFILWSTS